MKQILSLAVALMMSWSLAALPTAKQATAITKVYGDGVRFVAIGLEFPTAVTYKDVSQESFMVEGYTVDKVSVHTKLDLEAASESGKYVLLHISTDKPELSLAYKQAMTNATTTTTPKRGGKKWVAGDKLADNLAYREPQVTVQYATKRITTSAVRNLVVDDFEQLTFVDSKTGKTLRYNLYKPKGYGNESLPLVLFMHDAGVTSYYHRATLFQGLGAVVWASPEEQSKRPCYVLAPQFDEIIVDDNSETSPMMETTIHLIEELCGKYAIDRARIYTTGQSGGCMMSIAMNIKYPDLFAASYLVAGQWAPTLTTPLAHKKLWIMTSVDDAGAFPGQNAITKHLELNGAKVSRDFWDATWSANEYRYAYDKITANGTAINYTTFVGGSVFLPGASTAGASGHRNTWRVAYNIEPIREWLFAQRK